MNKNLIALFNSKLFWQRYSGVLEDDFAYEFLKDEPITFQLTDKYSLSIDTGEDLCYICLIFQYKKRLKTEIASDDDPFVLRFDEYQSITETISKSYKLEKWIPMLLLIRFVGPNDLNESDKLFELENELLQMSGLFSKQELAGLREDGIPVNEDWDAKWNLQPSIGWVYESEDDAYSLRTSENDEFPFKHWNKMLEQLA